MTKLTVCTLTTVALVAIAAPASAKPATDKGHSGKAPVAKATPAPHAKATKPVKPARARPLPAAVKDCAADGDLDRVYAPGLLNRALKRLPADLGAYTDCGDVLRFARAAGPVVPVTKKGARLRARCVGTAYAVKLAVGGSTIGTATVPACRRGTRNVRIQVTPAGDRQARRHRLATVTATPDGQSLQFVVRLTGRKL